MKSGIKGSLFGGLLVGIGALLLPTSALAAPAPSALSPSDEQEVRAWFEAYDVDESTIDSLIQNFNDGELWKSMEEDSVPERVYTHEDELGVPEQVAEYSDGSITVTSFISEKHASGTVQPYATTYRSCARTQSGSGWANYYECTVSAKTGVLEVVFHADYYRTTAAGGIYSAYSPYAYTTGGSANTPSLKVTRAKSSG